MFALNTTAFLWLLVIFLVAHSVLLILSARFNPLVILAIIFLMVATFSIAKLPATSAMKYVRVYSTILLFIVGVLFYGGLRFRGTALAQFLFTTYFTLAALWSAQPVWGLMYKGLFWLAAVDGLILARQCWNHQRTIQILRILFLGYMVMTVILLLGTIASPGTALSGRLQTFGLNPIAIGYVTGGGVILSTYVYINDLNALLRTVAMWTGIIAGILLLLTGTRQTFLFAAVPVLLLLMPLAKHPGRLLALVLALGFVAILLPYIVHSSNTGRVLSMEDDRTQHWTRSFELYVQEAPLFGMGWLYWVRGDGQPTTINAESSYMQILAETGAFGCMLWLVVTGYIASRMRQIWHMTQGMPWERNLMRLILGLFIGYLLANLGGLAMVTGTTFDCLLGTFAIGMAESVAHLVHVRIYQTNPQMRFFNEIQNNQTVQPHPT